MSDSVDVDFARLLKRRHLISAGFEWLCRIATWSSLLILAVLLISVLWTAWGWIDWQFVTSYDDYRPVRAGMIAGIWGSFWLMLLTALISVPLGVGAAIYLEEYSSDNWMNRIIKVNLSNLAGVPSIVYGILGLTVFVRIFGLFHGKARELSIHLGFTSFDIALPFSPKTLVLNLGFGQLAVPLPLDRTVMSAALTLSLLILPVVIIASQEALRSVPPSIRHASIALGATHWQTIRNQVLPAALPGIVTGIILSLARAIGETAPLILVGAYSYIAYAPGRVDTPLGFVKNPEAVLHAPFDKFTAMPMQIFGWAMEAKDEFRHVAAAGILVLLIAMILFNGVAVFLRNRYRKRINW